MAWTEAFELAENDARNRVLSETWGHLAPEEQKVYKGHILFVHAGYGGDIVILESKFKNLEDSPWFFNAMLDYVSNYIMKHKRTEGKIFRFDGTIQNYKFKGKIKKVKV